MEYYSYIHSFLSIVDVFFFAPDESHKNMNDTKNLNKLDFFYKKNAANSLLISIFFLSIYIEIKIWL